MSKLKRGHNFGNMYCNWKNLLCKTPLVTQPLMFDCCTTERSTNMCIAKYRSHGWGKNLNVYLDTPLSSEKLFNESNGMQQHEAYPDVINNAANTAFLNLCILCSRCLVMAICWSSNFELFWRLYGMHKFVKHRIIQRIQLIFLYNFLLLA